MNPVVTFGNPRRIENTFNDACPPVLIHKKTWQALLSGSQD